MSRMEAWVRERTDLLDSLGNTTAATGKGFANASAVLSALSILCAFTVESGIRNSGVNLIDAYVIIGILVGGLLPYIFGALTMLAVNRAAQRMIEEVRRQFHTYPEILE